MAAYPPGGLAGFALAGRTDKLALAAGGIAVDIEGTAGMGGSLLIGQMYNQTQGPAWHKPMNSRVFLHFSRSQPHEGPYS